MHVRLSALLRLGALGCVVLLAAAAASFAAGSGPQPLSQPARLDAAIGADAGEDALPPIQHPKTYERTVAWWPFLTGPYYGDTPGWWRRDPDVLKTLVGSFRIGESLPIPPELTASLAGIESGGKQYFLAQLRPSALTQPFKEELRRAGAEIVATLPVNGIVLRLDKAAYEAVSGSPLLQYIAPYHPAYKIDPAVGHIPQATPEKAASPVFDLVIRLFDGEPTAPTAQALRKMGAAVTYESGDANLPYIFATANAVLIPQIARLESVFTIGERGPQFQHGNRGARFLQSHTDSLALTYWKAGIDGDGQVIHVTDSGMSIDAGDKADTKADSLGPGAGTQLGPGTDADGCANPIGPNNTVTDHRKVICYQSANQYGGSGDFNSCDSAGDGGFSHGQLVSGIAAGNATRGRVPPVTDGHPNPTDDGTQSTGGDNTYARDYGGDGFWDDAPDNPTGWFTETDTTFDGVAKGAKLVFVDADTSCGAGISAGDLAAQINDTYTKFGANIHNFSFGSTAAPTGPVYTSGADAIDGAIRNTRVNFVAISAGNDGSSSDPGCGDVAGTLSNEAACKNCVPAGMSFGFNSLNGATSQGPADLATGRVGLLILAEGVDNACRQDDGATNDQGGPAGCINSESQGTSFASPNLAGAAALIGEYLAGGFYPDGTDQNASNANDQIPLFSSALTKAIMIAGTAAVSSGGDAGIVTPRDGRFNTVTGYGQLYLDYVLPLADDPTTVSGLILDALDDVDNDGVKEGPNSLGIPSPLAGTYQVDLQVLADDEDLRVALAWHDTNTSAALDIDLDMTLTYCGSDGVCNGGADEITWRGNVFAEDTSNACDNSWNDLDGDNVEDGYAYTIDDNTIQAAGFDPTTYTDHSNNTEAIFIPSVLNAKNVNGGIAANGSGSWQPLIPGTYQLTITKSSGAADAFPAVAISGPVAAGSSVRFSSGVLSCNDAVEVVVSETDDANDPACNLTIGCTPSTIQSRTEVLVLDANGVQGDQLPLGTLNFNQESDLRFRSDPIPLSIYTDPNDTSDGIATVDNDYTLRAIYHDDDGSGNPPERRSQAFVDCQPDIETAQISQLGLDERWFLGGGCDDDKYLDFGEAFSLSVAFQNLENRDLTDATVTARVCSDYTNNVCTPDPNVTVYDSEQQLGFLPAQTAVIVDFGLQVTGTPPAKQVDTLEICLKADKVGQGTPDCTTAELILQADDEVHLYSTDCPTGCTVRWDRNDDEFYEDRISAHVALNDFDPLFGLREGKSETKVRYENMTVAADEDNNGTPDCQENGNSFTCGNPGFNGPWDFDSDDEGFRSGHSGLSNPLSFTFTQWGEDYNWDGVLQPTEDADADNTLDENWSTAGGCGWMSQQGVWHTGTIGAYTDNGGASCRGDASICEEYDVYNSTNAQEYWFEMLRTPTIHPVHFGVDPRDNLEWRTQITDWSWNMQWNQDEDAAWTWDFDLDLNDERIALGDDFIEWIWSNPTGAISGGQVSILGGSKLFERTDENTGDGAGNGTIGGNRAGERGCYFNDIPAENRQLPESLPAPSDDDCDNNFDMGDGCPGTCAVDDDGNGEVDDLGELCPCKVCDAGPRAGLACSTSTFCNPAGGSTYHCVLDVNAAGVPNHQYGDDVCGNGATDEGVFASFDPAVTGERQTRNFPIIRIASSARFTGRIEFNTLEDFYWPVGDSWAGEIGLAVFEPSQPPVPSFGIALDDMVVEWQETHPQPNKRCAVSGGKCTVDDDCPGFPADPSDTCNVVTDVCSQASDPGFQGACATVSLSQETNTFDGDGVVTVSVDDPYPSGPDPDSDNIVECDGDPATRDVQAFVWSEAERVPEVVCLTETTPGSNHFVGRIVTTTGVAKPGDGLLFLAPNGNDNPSVNVRYFDRWDGVHGVSVGPDGQPGIAGVDDDGDGTIDNASELCSDQTSFGPGRNPHQPNTPARYSDDTCGCSDPNGQPFAGTLATFDTVDLVIAKVFVDDSAGDGDGFVDPGEQIQLDFLLRNLSDFDISNVRLKFTPQSLALIDCMTDDEIHIDNILANDKALGGSDEFDTRLGTDHVTFIAGGAGARASVNDDLTTTFRMTLHALGRVTPGSQDLGSNVDIPINGTAVAQSFEVVHNLDASGGGNPHTWTEDFNSFGCTGTGNPGDTCPNPLLGTGPGQWERYNTGDDPPELDGTRCQSNNPGNPFGANTEPEDFCELGRGGFDNTENHWHLHGTGLSCEGVPCPQPGKDHTQASGACLHLGNHIEADGTTFDDGTTDDYGRMNWIETAQNIQLGLGHPELSYWTQLRIADYGLFGISPASQIAMDAARVYVCVDKDNDNGCDTTDLNAHSGVNDCTGPGDPNCEVWEPISAYVNPEQSFRLAIWIDPCMLEPSDDGNNEDDFFPNSLTLGPSSTCFPGNGSDTCVGRTKEDSPFAGVLGDPLAYPDANCFPETGVVDSEVPGLYERNPNTGQEGIWAKKVYDLGRFAGQKILLRFHRAPMSLSGIENCAAVLSFFCGDRDDGWFIDDITITGVDDPITLSVDNASHGGGTCPTWGCGPGGFNVVSRLAAIEYPRNDRQLNPKPAVACSSNAQTPEFCDFDNDTIEDATTDTADAGAPGRPFILDASESTADHCPAGTLEYRFETSTGTVVRDWLTDPVALVTVVEDTTFVARVRCSEQADTDGDGTPDTTCESTSTVTLLTGFTQGPSQCCNISNLVFPDLANRSQFSWDPITNTACAAVYDASAGDLGPLHTNGMWTGQRCIEDDDATDTTATDTAADPAPGAGYWYLTRQGGTTLDCNYDPANQQGLAGPRTSADINACP